MNYSVVLETLELAALLVAVGLLYQLLKESRLLRRRLEIGSREKKDGQTINVNLTPVALSEGKTPSAPPESPAKPEPKKEPPPPEAEEPPAKPEPPKPIRALGSVTVTPGGAVAIKCPKCGAENSSYRTECFTCGASLR